MNRFALAILIIVLASAAGYAMFLRPERAPVPANDAGSQDKNEASNQTSESVGAKTHIVEFRDAGYVPSTLTIKAGDTVQFVNKTAGLFGRHPLRIPSTLIFLPLTRKKALVRVAPIRSCSPNQTRTDITTT